MLEHLSILNESLELRDYHYYALLVAKAYKDAPTMDRSALPHWRALRKAINRQFQMISRSPDKAHNPKRQRFNVVFSDDNPYNSAEDMRDQVKKTGDLVIWNGESEHPILSKEENLKLRAVHDYFAHIAGGASFGLRGEISAFNRHANFTPKKAAVALFTEVVGQAAYALIYGSFPVQKIAVLKGFDPSRLGEVSGYKIDDNRDLMNPRTGERFGPDWAKKNFKRDLNRDFALESQPEEERQSFTGEMPEEGEPDEKDRVIQKVFDPTGPQGTSSEAPQETSPQTPQKVVRTKIISRPT